MKSALLKDGIRGQVNRMNNDLISRSELLKALEPFGDIKSGAFCRGIEIARKIIEEQPAAADKREDDLK